MKRSSTFIIFFLLVVNFLSAQNCPQVINPVCGINGISYINPCYAEAAGVTDYTFGVCYSECIDPDEMDPDADCEDNYDPVCGCNQITYKNECEAKAAGVQAFQSGKCQNKNGYDPSEGLFCYNPRYILHSGGISLNILKGIITLKCSQGYDPVCGCDGLTYPNACTAEASGITSYTYGTCGDACVDPEKIDPKQFCAAVYDPVCGCNGVTYPNACRAEAAGVLKYTEGQCGSSQWCEAAVSLQCGDFKPNETTIGESNNIDYYPGCSGKKYEGPEKVYVINKTTAGDLQIGLEITTPDKNLDLFLLKGECDEVICLKSSKTSNTVTNNEGIIYENAPIGTYYIVVDGLESGSSGDFRLEVSCGILDCEMSKELTCGQPFKYSNEYGQDNVSLYQCGGVKNVENNGPEVVHSFSIPTAGPVDISLTGLKANLELFLLGDCDRGDCWKYSQNSGTKDEHISTYLEAGTYYVVVDGYNGAVSEYTLTVNCPSSCDLQLAVEAKPAECGKNNGKLILTSTGGTPGFLAAWEGPVSGSFYTNANVCTISNLPPGTYWVKKTDKNGCSDKKKVTITDGGNNIDLSVTVNQAACGGDGSLKIQIEGGKAPYKLKIYGPKNKVISTYYNSFLVSDLPPGHYSIHLSDANGCTDSEDVTIEQNNGYFYFTADPKSAKCETPGSIAIKTYFGTPPYHIYVQGPVSGSASTQKNNFSLTNLPGGSYKITIKDGGGCSHSEMVVVPDEDMTIQAEPTAGICGKDGSILVEIENGKPGFQISWEGPVDGSTTVYSSTYLIEHLPTGTYKIKVIDKNWCTDYTIVTIDNSDDKLDVIAHPIDGVCSLGAIWLEIKNGEAPYKINWTGPKSGQDWTNNSGYEISDLPSGTYTIFVVDVNGCTDYKIIDIYNYLGPKVTLSSTLVSCESEGSITVHINGGKPAYYIRWSGPVEGNKTTSSTSYTIDHLPKGNYKVIVHDDYSCKVEKYIEVEEKPDDLELWVDTQNGVCGDKGVIEGKVNGGMAPFKIQIKGDKGFVKEFNQNDRDFWVGNLPSDTYRIWVKDKNGCEEHKKVVIVNDPGNLELWVDTQNGICGDKGVIEGKVNGGMGPFKIQIKGDKGFVKEFNQNDRDFWVGNLPSDTYRIWVKDKNGCEEHKKVVIVNDPGNLELWVDTQNGVCGDKGVIEGKVNGGMGPFKIQIKGDKGFVKEFNQNDRDFWVGNLPSDTYRIWVKDKNGCEEHKKVVIVNDPGNLELWVDTQNGVCGDKGVIEGKVNGGMAPFKIQIKGDKGFVKEFNQNDRDFWVGNLPSDTYRIWVKDKNGCEEHKKVVIVNDPGNLELWVDTQNGICGDKGVIEGKVNGGMAPFKIQIKGDKGFVKEFNQNDRDFWVGNLPSDTYRIWVKDKNGCEEHKKVVIVNDPGNLELWVDTQNGICGDKGVIEGKVNGGMAPFKIQIKGDKGFVKEFNQNDRDFWVGNLPSDTYRIWVKDKNGCEEHKKVVIVNDPGNLELWVDTQNGICGDKGVIEGKVNGGMAPFKIQIKGDKGFVKEFNQNDRDFWVGNLPSDTYRIWVKDKNGCEVHKEVIIKNDPGDLELWVDTQNGICGDKGVIEGKVNGGMAPFKIQIKGDKGFVKEFNQNDRDFWVGNLPSDTYRIWVKDKNGCEVHKEVIIKNDPGNLELWVDTQNGICGDKGVIEGKVNGGMAPFKIQIKGDKGFVKEFNQNDRDFWVGNLPSDTYRIWVKDKNGCEVHKEVIIKNDPGNLELWVDTQNGICGDKGVIEGKVNGGMGPFKIQIKGDKGFVKEFNQNDRDFWVGNLPSDTYRIWVKDKNGCEVHKEVIIKNDPGDLELWFDTQNGICGDKGVIEGKVNGGMGPFKIQIKGDKGFVKEFNQNDRDFWVGNLPSDTYRIWVKDKNGCEVHKEVIIKNDPGDLELWVDTQNGICGDKGVIEGKVNGGMGPFKIQIKGDKGFVKEFNQNDRDFWVGNLPSDTYRIWVKDKNGCEVHKEVIIKNDPGDLELWVEKEDGVCGDKGIIKGQINGGMAKYYITVTGPDGFEKDLEQNDKHFKLEHLASGLYKIWVKDKNGCEAHKEITIENSPGDLDLMVDAQNGVCGDKGIIEGTIKGGMGKFKVLIKKGDQVVKDSEQDGRNIWIDGLPSGTYSIWIKDKNGCEVHKEVIIKNDPGDLELWVEKEDGVCGDKGIIKGQINGGMAKYYITVTGPDGFKEELEQNDKHFKLEHLASGLYKIWVKDKNGCEAHKEITIENSPGDLDLMVDAQNGVCGDKGIIEGTIKGGMGKFKVLIKKGDQVVKDSEQDGRNIWIDGLPSGTYSIWIKDKNGCEVHKEVIIKNDPGDLELWVEKEDGVCGDKGIIKGQINGGMAKYYITVTGPDGFKEELEQNDKHFKLEHLASGLYKIWVKDKNGCEAHKEITIENSPGDLDLMVDAQNGVCGDKGIIEGTIKGGMGKFKVLIKKGDQVVKDSEQDGRNIWIDGLPSGTYSIWIKDKNGCEVHKEVIIKNDPGDLELWVEKEDGVCGDKGIIKGQINGGMAKYYITVTGPDGFKEELEQNDKHFKLEHLASGLYKIWVKDKNGCEAHKEITIENSPGDLDLMVDAQNGVCGDKGIIEGTIKGGMGKFKVLIKKGDQVVKDSEQDGRNIWIDGLPSGTYSIWIKDKNGCEVHKEVIIKNDPGDLELWVEKEDGVCGDKGIIKGQINGGMAKYYITVTGPDGFEEELEQNDKHFRLEHLASGLYKIWVKDKNGCEVHKEITIENKPGDLELWVEKEDGVCGDKGIIKGQINGGMAKYYITVTGPDGFEEDLEQHDHSFKLEHLASGLYKIWVKDKNGCEVHKEIIIENKPGDLELWVEKEDGVCGDKGIIKGQINGGMAKYYITVTGPDGFEKDLEQNDHSFKLEHLASGLYKIWVKDKNGCEAHKEITIENSPGDLDLMVDAQNGVCGDKGIIEGTIKGGMGKFKVLIKKGDQVVKDSEQDGRNIWIDGLPSGTYSIWIKDKNGCEVHKEVIIKNDPGDLELWVEKEDGVCGDKGIIKGQINGGMAKYYITVTGPDGFEEDLEQNDHSFKLEHLASGLYKIWVKDKNGCEAHKEIIIENKPGDLELWVEKEDGVCGDKGIIKGQINGGMAKYYITVTGPDGFEEDLEQHDHSFKLEHLASGLYKIWVKDKYGCEVHKEIIIENKPGDLELWVEKEDGVCGDKGIIKGQINGGMAKYYITVTGPDGFEEELEQNDHSFKLEHLASGLYKIWVKDKNGCEVHKEIIIENKPGDLELWVEKEDGVCGDKGIIKGQINGGMAKYYITVTGPDGFEEDLEQNDHSFKLEHLASGLYKIWVKDKNGCEVHKEITIENKPGDLELKLEGQAGICGDKGIITGQIKKGKPGFMVRAKSDNGYDESFDLVSRDFKLFSLAEGTYNIWIKDDNGCETHEEVIIKNDPGNLQILVELEEGECGTQSLIKGQINNGKPHYEITLKGPGNTDKTLNQANKHFEFDGLGSGTYTIWVTDKNGCQAHKEVIIKNTAGQVSAKFDSEVTALTAKFKNESSTGTYHWDFGDGNTSEEENPSYEFCEAGKYKVCLTVTNDCGTDQFCKFIEVTIPTDICVLNIGEAEGAKGSKVLLPVTIHNCPLIVSLEGSLESMNPEVAMITSIKGNIITPHFNPEKGSFNFYDNLGVGVKVLNGDILFYVEVLLKGDPGDMSVIKFSNSPLKIELGTLLGGLPVAKAVLTLKGKVTVESIATIDGRISTYWDEGILDAEVSLTGQDYSSQVMTDAEGYYMLPDIPSGAMYDIAPSKNTGHTNGLSTYALFAGQRFILGYEPEEIESPYQIIAGDANCNGSFTTLDLFIIQQIIIGVRSEFSDCPAWVFVSKNSTMPPDFDAYNVFPYKDRESMMVEGEMHTDFVGVKVGDILGHANPTNFTGGIKIRNQEVLTFKVQNRGINKGESFELSFRSDEFTDIVSYQLGLGFDTDYLNFEAFVKPSTSQLSSVVAGTNPSDTGILRISWFDLNGQGFNANPDTDIFTVQFTAQKDIEDLGQYLFVSDRSISAEAHNRTATTLDITLEFESALTAVDPVKLNGYQLHQNTPNPFSESTSILFELPENMEAEILIHNQFGQVIKVYQGGFVKGRNKVEVEELSLAPGVYYYTLKAEEFRQTKSMIVIR